MRLTPTPLVAVFALAPHLAACVGTVSSDTSDKTDAGTDIVPPMDYTPPMPPPMPYTTDYTDYQDGTYGYDSGGSGGLGGSDVAPMPPPPDSGGSYAGARRAGLSPLPKAP